jgi:DNA-binding transcriptional MerR regulator
LLSPARNDNGYREYSEADIEILKKIILLRKMGISIEDIKAQLAGEEKLSEVVNRNVLRIEEQMKELQGALHISQMMQKDQNLDQEFQLDKYWNVMEEEEQQGSKFFDVVKDYMEFESGVFFGMWGTAFMTDLKGLISGKKYATAFIIVAILCLVRGLAYHYIWQMGSIVEGAVYPFVIFAVASIVIFPLYVLSKKFSDKDEYNVSEKYENDTSEKCENDTSENSGDDYIENVAVTTDTRGCLTTSLTVVFMVVGVIFCVLFAPFMVEKLYLNRINAGMQYVSSSCMVIPYFIAALFFVITIYWLISKQGLLANSKKLNNGEEGLVCHLPKKIRVMVAVVALLLYLLTSWLYATCYNQTDDTGFEKRRVFANTHYQYEDVEYYRLYAQADGTLGLYFRLKDGSKVEYYGSVISSNVDDSEEYAVALVQKLNALDVKCKIVNEEKLYKRLRYDYWKETAEQIIAVSDVVED